MSLILLNEMKGDVRFNDLSQIDESSGIEINIESLKEDLLQVVYRNDIILDVGFYPEFDPLGRIVVAVIYQEDWTCPVLTMKTQRLEHIVSIIMLAEEFIISNLVAK